MSELGAQAGADEKRGQMATADVPVHESTPQVIPSTQKPRFLRRKPRIIFGIILLLGCTGTAYYYYVSITVEERLKKALAELDRLDPGWRLDDILKNQPKFPDAENGALQRIAVQRMLPARWWGPTLTFGGAPEVQLSADQLARFRAKLKELSPAVQAARKLAYAPRGSEPITWTRNGLSTPLSQPMETLELVRFLRMDVEVLAQDGEIEKAMTSCRAMVCTGRTLGDSPSLMSALLRVACQTLARGSLQRVLAQGEPTEAALADLQLLLEEEAAQAVLLNAFRVERASFDNTLEALQTGEAKFSEVFPPISPRWVRQCGFSDDWIYSLRFGSIKNNRAAFLECFTSLIETDKLHPIDRLRAIEEVSKRIRELPWLARSELQMYAKYQQDKEVDYLHLTTAIAALATERYRLAHGRWPESLEVLVPQYLDRVPDDIFADGPLRLQSLDDGLVIASVGKTGSKPRTLANFRLWDVKHRRQPATEADKSRTAGKK
jgi:hypothetical protein